MIIFEDVIAKKKNLIFRLTHFSVDILITLVKILTTNFTSVEASTNQEKKNYTTC